MKTETVLQQKIKEFEAKSFNPFKPSRTFFTNVKIGQKRFWKLVRGEESLKLTEMEALATYFGVPVNDFTTTPN